MKPDIVQERYITSLKLLSHYFDKPDKLQLFDNSGKTQLLAEIEKGNILHVIPILPGWVVKYLNANFQQGTQRQTKAGELKSIDEVRKMYTEMKGRGGNV